LKYFFNKYFSSAKFRRSAARTTVRNFIFKKYFKSRENARLALVAQRTHRKSTSLAISRTLGFFFPFLSAWLALFIFSRVVDAASRSSCQLTRTRPQQQHETKFHEKKFFFSSFSFGNKIRQKNVNPQNVPDVKLFNFQLKKSHLKQLFDIP
jgi:hypothetical protein